MILAIRQVSAAFCRPCGSEPHDVTLTASQKCLCKHTFLLRGIICAMILPAENHSGFATSALCAAAPIDGLAKMFVQAHIFASWYNIPMILAVRHGAARCDIDG